MRFLWKDIFRQKSFRITAGPWLILKDNPESSIEICWHTKDKKTSELRWGTSGTSLRKSEISPRSRNHRISLSKLKPDKLYYFSIIEDLYFFRKEYVFSFRTAKRNPECIDFIISGDLQPNDDYTIRTNKIFSERIDKENPDFIVQTGDLVHLGNSSKAWFKLLKILPGMASGRPILAAIGNHEYYPFYDNKAFRKFFPYNFEDRNACYYSFDYKTIHFSFLDAYEGGYDGMNSKVSEEQKLWFIKDLKKAIENNCQWIFVILHQPVFTNGEFPEDVELKNWILPIISHYNVDAVFWGHSHLYEHWYYKYGDNGFVLNHNDVPGEDFIDYFCIGSSGIDLESNYNLFTHQPYVCKDQQWFNLNTQAYEYHTFIHYPWDKINYSDGYINSDYFKESELHYFHDKSIEKEILSDNRPGNIHRNTQWYNYVYGENAMHYAKIHIENNICRLSIHYANGDILQGLDNNQPQIFNFKKKYREHISDKNFHITNQIDMLSSNNSHGESTWHK